MVFDFFILIKVRIMVLNEELFLLSLIIKSELKLAHMLVVFKE